VQAKGAAWLPLKTMQRMASWGTRYGNICLLMKPFTSALYFAKRGKTNHHCLVTLGPQACTSVQMLRVLMLLVFIDEAAYARPLESWRPLVADADPLSVALCLAAVVGLIDVFDASLKGIGVLWYAACADGSRRLIAGAAFDIQSLHFGSDALSRTPRSTSRPPVPSAVPRFCLMRAWKLTGSLPQAFGCTATA
jgi:hypothetical protein